MGTIGDDRLVLHEQRNKGGWEQLEEQRHRDDDGERSLARKADRLFHTADVAAGVVIADQRHDALGKSLGNVHRNHVDLLTDTHGSDGVCAISGSEVVEQGHAGDVEQVLNRGRDADRTHAADNLLFEGEFLGVDADKGASAFDSQQHKEIQAGDTVGDKGGKSRAAGSHVKSPWQDKDRVEDDVEQTAAHGADAGVHGRAFRADQISHDDIEDGRYCTAGDGPQHIGGGGVDGGAVCTQQAQQRLAKDGAAQGEDGAAAQCAVKAKGGAVGYGFIVFSSQRTAHHAGAADAEQVVDGVEGKQHRRSQCDRCILDRVVEHADKVGVGKVVDDHDQRAEDGRNGKLCNSFRDGSLFKQDGFTV